MWGGGRFLHFCFPDGASRVAHLCLLKRTLPSPSQFCFSLHISPISFCIGVDCSNLEGPRRARIAACSSCMGGCLEEKKIASTLSGALQNIMRLESTKKEPRQRSRKNMMVIMMTNGADDD